MAVAAKQVVLEFAREMPYNNFRVTHYQKSSAIGQDPELRVWKQAFPIGLHFCWVMQGLMGADQDKPMACALK